MTTSTTNFIDAVLTKMCDNKGRDGEIAKIVQSVAHSEPGNRIVIAATVLGKERNRLKAVERETGVPSEFNKPKPEVMLSFCQRVLNETCWHARRYYNQLVEQAAEERENGIDFTQDLAEQLNVDYTLPENVSAMVDADFRYMLGVHSYLAGKMSYLTDIRDLDLFQVLNQHEDGTWFVEASAQTFEEAQSLMETQILQMQEDSEAEELEEAANFDFSAFNATA